jgi:hypothetical protein
MNEDIQPVTDTPSAAPESSAPVADIRPSVAPATTDTSSQTARTSRGRSSKKSSGDKLADSMEQTYNRIQARGDSLPDAATDVAPEGPSLNEIYGKRDASINELANTFDTLPDEAREYLRSAIDRPKMPQAWGADRAEAWAKLDASTQGYIAQRELEAAQKITELGQEVSHMRQSGGMVGELADVVAHFTPRLPPEVANMSRPEQIARLYAASEAIHRDPIGSIIQLARHHGVDLSQIGGNPQAAAQQREVLAQHQQAVAQLQSEVSRLRQQQSQYQSQRAQWLQQEALEYLKDKEYSPEFENEIHHQVAAIRDRNPAQFEIDPMSVLREAERRAFKFTGHGDKSSAEEAKKKADEAKRLSSLNVKSKIGRSPSNVSGDMWSPDNWEAAYSKASGR